MMIRFAVAAALYVALILQAAAQFSPTPALISGQISVGGGGGSTACAYGMAIPNSLIPQSATNAGFTTCVLYIDFTTITSTQLTNWISCSGNAGSSPFLQLQYGFSASQVPCGRMTLITDSGTQVLDLSYTSSDTANADIHLANQPGVFTQPFGSFLQAILNVPASSYTNSPTNFTFIEIGGMYSFGVSPVANGPDYFELGCSPASNCTVAGSVGQNAVDFNDANGHTAFLGNNPFLNLDLSSYHILSALNTTDGSANLFICPYVDKTPTVANGSTPANGCVASPNPSTNQANTRLGLNFPYTGPEVAGGTMRGNMEMRVKQLFILSCANWATQNCAGTTFSTAPSY